MPDYIVYRRETHVYEMEYRVTATDEAEARAKVEAPNDPTVETWKQNQIEVREGAIEFVEEA